MQMSAKSRVLEAARPNHCSQMRQWQYIALVAETAAAAADECEFEEDAAAVAQYEEENEEEESGHVASG